MGTKKQELVIGLSLTYTRSELTDGCHDGIGSMVVFIRSELTDEYQED